MAKNASHLVARLLWAVPVFLLVLAANQVKVASDIHRTVRDGVLATADVVAYDLSNRADVTYDFIGLRVVLDDGTVVERDRLSLPHTFAAEMEGKDEVAVRVLPDTPQPIVIADLGRAHWRMALLNAAMCIIGLLMTVPAIMAWNRYLSREGDPADRAPQEADTAAA